MFLGQVDTVPKCASLQCMYRYQFLINLHIIYLLSSDLVHVLAYLWLVGLLRLFNVVKLG